MSLIGKLADVPVLGDAIGMLRGDPDAIKDAYDKAMGQSSLNAEKLKQFLMGAKGQAQQFYAPLQGMFTRAYGGGNINAPVQPGVPGSAPLTSMFNRSGK